MKLSDFLATRTQHDDLRLLPDCPYGERNGGGTGDDSVYADPVYGYAYEDGTRAIEQGSDGVFTVYIQYDSTFRDLLSAELELWYYYGRFDGPQEVDLTLFDRLEMACLSSDLDAAARYVQDGLGVQSGDRAALFFSYVDGIGPSEETWPNAPLRKRFEWMREYIRSELCEVDARLERETDGIVPREDIQMTHDVLETLKGN